MKRTQGLFITALCILLCMAMSLTACQEAEKPGKPHQPETTAEIQENTDKAPDTRDEFSETAQDTEPADEPTAEPTDETTAEPAETDPPTPQETEEPPVETNPPEQATSAPVLLPEDPGLTVLEVGGNQYDGVNPGVNHTADILISSERDYTVPQGRETATITFNGVTYTGAFDYRASSAYPSEDILNYVTSISDGPDGWLQIGAETGKLVGYLDLSLLGKTEGPVLGEEECVTLAEKFLVPYLQASGRFESTVLRYTYRPDIQCGYYEISFRHYIGDTRVAGGFQVLMDDKGCICMFMATNLGLMDGVEVPDYDEEAVNAAVAYKLAQIFQNVEKEYTLIHEIQESYLTKLKDGHLYLYFSIHTGAKNRPSFCEFTNLLVRID